MAKKKFFYDKVYNTKRTIINVIIICVCIIGIILCFVLTSNFQGQDPTGELNIKKDVSVEINEEFTNKIFFKKVENVDLDEVEIRYPDDYDIIKLGKYDVSIIVNQKKFDVKLSVVDTKKPELELKELTIHEGSTYDASSFVVKCEDNSKEDCNIEFYTEGMNEEGEKVDYSTYKAIGTYPIKVIATDNNKNYITKETKLNIVKKGTVIKESEGIIKDPKNCKYGTSEYNVEENLVAIDITSGGCAINAELYNDDSMTGEINKLMEAETTRILKDMEAVNVTGTPALNRKVSAVVNTTNTGIVGYELRMTITITNGKNTETILDYKVDSEGKRVFTKNPFNIPS